MNHIECHCMAINVRPPLLQVEIENLVRALERIAYKETDKYECDAYIGGVEYEMVITKKHNHE